MPPACPGSNASKRYRRDHSNAVLVHISSNNPPQNMARHSQGPWAAAPGTGSPPRIQRASDDSQARTPAATHHQTEKPNRK